MSFILTGSFKSDVKSKNIEMKYKAHIELVHELFNSWNDRCCSRLMCLIETSLNLLKGKLYIYQSIYSFLFCYGIERHWRLQFVNIVCSGGSDQLSGPAMCCCCILVGIPACHAGDRVRSPAMVSCNFFCHFISQCELADNIDWSIFRMNNAWWANYIGDFKWRLHFSSWRCILKGCFERGIFWRTKSSLNGIKDFNLEHMKHMIKAWGG